MIAKGHLDHFNCLSMGFNLSHLFERIARSWGADKVRILADNINVDPDLTVERSVRLSGTLQGTLDIRCGEAFLEWVQEKRSDHYLGRYPAEEILDEMISLYSLYLYHDFWNPDDFQVGPLKPVHSSPQVWPSDRPDCSCSIMVEDHRVEIRLWLEKTADS